MENNSDLDTLASLTVKINGYSIFSKIIKKKCFESVDVKLFEGKNKIELFANGQLYIQDSIAVSWPHMYYLNIQYYDSAGQQKFNYIIEEYFFQ